MFAAKDLLLTRPSGGYNLTRSLRFRSSASAYLNRTQGTPTSSQKMTLSFWVKRGKTNATYSPLYSGSSGSAAGGDQLAIYDGSVGEIRLFLNGGVSANLITTQVFRDFSAWYHIVVSIDTTQATAANRVIFYINGVQVTAFSTASYPAQNYNLTQFFANTNVNRIGSDSNTAEYFDGYRADFYGVDGQALSPTSFGATNATTGVWAPIKYTGTYGTNGFHLDFNSYGSTAALGTDTSGNGNTWTVNNCSVTAGVTYDSMIDVPTVSATGSNYCTLNPVDKAAAATWSDGNLAYSQPTGAGGAKGTFAVSSGKWYWEVTPTANGQIIAAGPVTVTGALADFTSAQGGYGYYWTNGNKYVNGVSSAYGAAYAINDVIGVALDMDALTITFYKNNTSQGAITGVPAGTYAPFVTNGAGVTTTGTYNFGQRPFTYTPPSGYSALNTYNLPAPSILIGAAHMAATTYTGTGASLTVANTVNSSNFQPDFVWMKGRSGATNHALYDSVRGTTKDLASNTTAAETTEATGLTAFGSTGFTIGALAKINTNAATYVGWQWKGSGTTVSNTTGSITSTVCVNPTAGFSIAGYTGTGAAATVGHGLGVAPSMIIVRNRIDGSVNWRVFHTSIGATNFLSLNLTSASAAASSVWNNTAPTSSVFSIAADGGSNGSAQGMIAYSFAPIAGYSAFGSYTGNGSADGPFVYCGFRPRWVMLKNSSAVTQWFLYDTTRNTYNVAGYELYANLANAEDTTGVDLDILSSGFKIRSSSTNNGSTNTVIYAAFAESPFKNSLAR